MPYLPTRAEALSHKIKEQQVVASVPPPAVRSGDTATLIGGLASMSNFGGLPSPENRVWNPPPMSLNSLIYARQQSRNVLPSEVDSELLLSLASNLSKEKAPTVPAAHAEAMLRMLHPIQPPSINMNAVLFERDLANVAGLQTLANSYHVAPRDPSLSSVLDIYLRRERGQSPAWPQY